MVGGFGGNGCGDEPFSSHCSVYSVERRALPRGFVETGCGCDWEKSQVVREVARSEPLGLDYREVGDRDFA